MTTSSRPRASTAVVLAMLGLWLCWGSSFPAMRVMVATLPPLLASGTVFVVAGIVLGAARPSALRGLSRRQLSTAAGVGVCLLGAQGMVAVAEQHVFASTAALLVAVVPLWVVVLRVAVGDRPTRAGVARLLVGFAGVVVVLVAGSGGGVRWSAWVLVVVGAAISWAGGTLWASRSGSLPGARAATVVQLLVGGLVLLAIGVFRGEPGDFAPAAVATGSWLALGYLVLIDSLAGFVLYNWLLRAAPVALVSTYAYAVPVVAYLIGVFALREPFHPVVLAGAATIVVAVAAEVRAGQ
ncbi:EamA family transporter [Saccharopolyspora soli]|uniref:EamA family transporter n=1 Tax=Saccharopolyspora soli TaxID=2926618 RepID=UPI001F599302|nr:EamA family transporter [Saccharopolyspora soli]